MKHAPDDVGGCARVPKTLSTCAKREPQMSRRRTAVTGTVGQEGTAARASPQSATVRSYVGLGGNDLGAPRTQGCINEHEAHLTFVRGWRQCPDQHGKAACAGPVGHHERGRGVREASRG